MTKDERNKRWHFRVAIVRFHITLAPCYLNDPWKGIHEYLGGFLMKYVPELQGVMVSYSDVKIVEDKARIMYDSPYIRFQIATTVTVFAPRLNSIIEGIVNKVSPDHIGILVFGVFNASIPASHIRKPEFTWKPTFHAWGHRSSESALVKPGVTIRFTIIELPTINGMLTLSGSLTQDPHHTGIVDVDEREDPHPEPLVDTNGTNGDASAPEEAEQQDDDGHEVPLEANQSVELDDVCVSVVESTKNGSPKKVTKKRKAPPASEEPTATSNETTEPLKIKKMKKSKPSEEEASVVKPKKKAVKA